MIVGLTPAQEGFFLDCLFQLREANLSVFRDRRRSFQHRPLPWPLAWNAEAGRLSGGLKPVTDEAAVSQTAIEVTPGSEGAGVATYEVDVPVGCSYQLCCRMRASMPGQSLSAKVDNGPLALSVRLPTGRVPPLRAAATVRDGRGQAQPDDRPASAGDEARSARTRPPSDQTGKLRSGECSGRWHATARADSTAASPWIKSLRPPPFGFGTNESASA